MRGHPGNCAGFGEEIVSGNIFIRPVILEKAGDVTGGHTHTFDHTSIFLSGSFSVRLVHPVTGSSEVRQITAPAHLLIKAEIEHTITCTSPEGGNFWCVYSHRDQGGGVVQEYNGDLEAYG